MRDHTSDALRAALPLLLAASGFALAFDGPPASDDALVWVAVPAARECLLELLRSVGS